MTKRERYTERARPHRREASAGGGPLPPTSDGMRNPIVMIAVGGFVVAAVMATAILLGRNMAADSPPTTDGGTPVITPEAIPAGATMPVSETIESATPAAAAESPSGDPMATPRYTAPEDQGLDPSTTAYFVTFETDKGTIRAQLWPDLAPLTVNSFVFLARDGYFDGLKFHRVVPDFVIQGGDPTGTGSGGPGYSLPAEFTDVPHTPGILSMARTSDPNSAGSQFFIVTGEASNLNNQYAVFGYVLEGMDVVYQIAMNDKMNKVTIEEKPIAESEASPADARAGSLPDNS
jgi:peptidylprolyl isomerase